MKKILMFVMVGVLCSFGVAKAQSPCFPDQCSVIPQWAVDIENAKNQERDASWLYWTYNFSQGIEQSLPDDTQLRWSLQNFIDHSPVFVKTSSQPQNLIYRDTQNNFFLNGKHLDLPTFRSLKLNAEKIQSGQMVELAKAQ